MLTAARYYVGVLAATILVIATNAGLIGISRLSWSLAEHRQLPAVFCPPPSQVPHALVHDRVLLGIAGLLMIPGKTDFLGNLYSFGAMLSFTIAHVSIIALRSRTPPVSALPCPLERPLPRRPVPLAAVLGALGTFAAWVSVVVLHTEARTVGIGWMIVGMAGYFLYRRRRARPEVTYRIPDPPAGRLRELAYRSALVRSWHDVSGRWRAPRSRSARSPWTPLRPRGPGELSLDRGLEEEEEEGRSVLEVARMQAKVRRLPGALPADPDPEPGTGDRGGGEGAALGPDLHLDGARAERGAAARPDNEVCAGPPALPCRGGARRGSPRGGDERQRGRAARCSHGPEGCSPRD